MALSRANLQKIDQILKQAEELSDSDLRYLSAEIRKMIGKPGSTTDTPVPFDK